MNSSHDPDWHELQHNEGIFGSKPAMTSLAAHQSKVELATKQRQKSATPQLTT